MVITLENTQVTIEKTHTFIQRDDKTPDPVKWNVGVIRGSPETIDMTEILRHIIVSVLRRLSGHIGHFTEPGQVDEDLELHVQMSSLVS
jgi:hypothetical protein